MDNNAAQAGPTVFTIGGKPVAVAPIRFRVIKLAKPSLLRLDGPLDWIDFAEEVTVVIATARAHQQTKDAEAIEQLRSQLVVAMQDELTVPEAKEGLRPAFDALLQVSGFRTPGEAAAAAEDQPNPGIGTSTSSPESSPSTASAAETSSELRTP